MADLPINKILSDLVHTLESHSSVVIQAPPGAGKTTRVPPALLAAPWLGKKHIIMLEPRRVAARAASRHMATLLGEKVGKTVGYQVRMDRKVSRATRIQVVTEGILTARLQSDPGLEGVGVVVFDEFHERHINTDLGLALCLEIQEALREDLKIVVMSATLDAGPVATLLGNAPVLSCQGRTWPVETRYVDPLSLGGVPVRNRLHPGQEDRALEQACAWAILEALDHEQGDVLVFLPGMKEIRRMEAQLKEKMAHAPHKTVAVLPLHGSLPPRDQDRAIVKDPGGRRKVVLATAIAETSITMEGVTTVVDTGRMRVARFYPGRGMDRLETLTAPRAAVDQRRGRAGRMGPGVCYRLWARQSHGQRIAFPLPEIMHSDLADTALQLALWGTRNPEELKWLDPPPEGAFNQAISLLQRLGAVDEQGAVTPHGRTMAAVGVHPRLGHMIIKGRAMGLGCEACYLAALLVERDIFSFSAGNRETDMGLRLAALGGMGTCTAAGTGRGSAMSVHSGAMDRVRATARMLARKLGISLTKPDTSRTGQLLSFAFPERVAMARPGQRGFFLMASGTGIRVRPEDPLAGEAFIVAAHLDGQGHNALLRLGAAYGRHWIETDFDKDITETEKVAWDPRTRSVSARREKSYGALLLTTTRLDPVDAHLQARAMAAAVQQEGLDLLPWTRALRSWQARACFLRNTGVHPDFPPMDDVSLIQTVETWLLPFLMGIASAGALKKLDLSSALKSRLTWEQQRALEQDAPTHLTVPSGSRIPLKYPGAGMGGVGASGAPPADDQNGPILAVRLQEMFGCTDTPTVARGRVTVMLHLLSPAGRPVQITRDLAGFWKKTYNDVKKDLMGRYPRHYWPEDPLQARPTHRAKPRR